MQHGAREHQAIVTHFEVVAVPAQRIGQHPVVPGEFGQRQPDGSCRLHPGNQCTLGLHADIDVHQPVAEVGCTVAAGQSTKVPGAHPASVGDHPLRIGAGEGHRCAPLWVHLQNGAAAHRLATATLTQYVVVAGCQRKRPRQVEAKEPLVTRFDCVGAEHPHAYRPLAGAQVQHVGSAAGQLMVEVAQHADRSVHHGRWPPVIGPHHRDAASDLAAGNSAECHGVAVTRIGPVDRCMIGVELADACRPSTGLQLDRVTHLECRPGK